MGNIITPVLPHDLPENWNDTQYVSPGGTEVGLTEKHGYNYLMKQVNNSQKAINELDAELEKIDTTLQNKAPIGYVQGVYDLRNYDSLDALLNVEYGDTPDNSAKVILIADNAGTTWGGGDCFAVIQRSNAHYGVVDFVSYNFNGTALRKALVNGVWLPLEWVNPPMALGVEYRTTERYRGSPVYVKLVDCGALPNNDYKTVNIGASGLEKVIDVSGCAVNPSDKDFYSIPTINFKNSVHNIGVYATGSQSIAISTQSDRSSYNAHVKVKYTKTTD